MLLLLISPDATCVNRIQIYLDICNSGIPILTIKEYVPYYHIWFNTFYTKILLKPTSYAVYSCQCVISIFERSRKLLSVLRGGKKVALSYDNKSDNLNTTVHCTFE
jgi:hypothetical protein